MDLLFSDGVRNVSLSTEQYMALTAYQAVCVLATAANKEWGQAIKECRLYMGDDEAHAHSLRVVARSLGREAELLERERLVRRIHFNELMEYPPS